MISVIVPVFNVEKYLSKCLESITHQTLSNIEIICVNDGSTDNSLEILENFAKKDPRVKVYTKENGGLSSARNFGLDRAVGDFVAFVDSDDELYEDALENLFKSLVSDSTLASVGSIKVCYEAHHELKESDDSYYRLTNSGKTALTDSVIDSFHYSACGCLFSKEVIDNFHLRFPEGLYYEDAWWHWAFFSQLKFVSFVNKPVYKYFRRSVSIMSQTFDKSDDRAIHHLYVFDKLLNFWKNNNQLSQRQGTLLLLLENFFWFSFRYSPPQERPFVICECMNIMRKYNIKVNSNPTLCKIQKGDLSTFFPSNEEGKNDLTYARYLQIKSAVDKLFPENSRRRLYCYGVARRLFKFLKGL